MCMNLILLTNLRKNMIKTTFALRGLKKASDELTILLENMDEPDLLSIKYDLELSGYYVSAEGELC